MNTIVTPGNTPHVATLFDPTQIVSQHRKTQKSAAMSAALLVRFQYSHESKSQFRRKCLEHLKAYLAPVQKASA